MDDDVFEMLQSSPPAKTPRGGARDKAARAPARLMPEERDCLVLTGTPDGFRRESLRQSVELVAIARDGGVVVIGWADDVECPIVAIVVTASTWRVAFSAASLVRLRRTDVEQALQAAPAPFGYVGLVTAPALRDVSETVDVELVLADGGTASAKIGCKPFTPEGLRDLLLGYLAAGTFMGNHQVEAVSALDAGMGNQIVSLNRAITTRITKARHVERFGVQRRQPQGSIVVCLYGKPEFLFVQNALFSGRPGIEDYEFVFVSNSPEMSEALLAEARAAHMVYGLRQTIVLLPGNAGFGAANNAAVGAALGKRILNVNPDVFPRQQDWAARHTALCAAAPAEQTRLFGTTLYYDDGTLMHGGMYFEMDPGITIGQGRIERRRLARVEHYGKGAPDWADTYVRPRPVPALTGAFISSDRTWYERLGGFTEDFVFGHYEDADLCLKSFTAGTPAWLHDIRMWHLEGKGSTRRPHHEGGSLVNRWLFTSRWTETVSAGLTGPAPTHPLLQPPAADAAGPRARARPSRP